MKVHKQTTHNYHTLIKDRKQCENIFDGQINNMKKNQYLSGASIVCSFNLQNINEQQNKQRAYNHKYKQKSKKTPFIQQNMEEVNLETNKRKKNHQRQINSDEIVSNLERKKDNIVVQNDCLIISQRVKNWQPDNEESYQFCNDNQSDKNNIQHNEWVRLKQQAMQKSKEDYQMDFLKLLESQCKEECEKFIIDQKYNDENVEDLREIDNLSPLSTVPLLEGQRSKEILQLKLKAMKSIQRSLTAMKIFKVKNC